jgi:hypothetical protein
MKIYTQFWYEKLKERDNLEDLGVDVGMLLQCILKKQDWRLWIHLAQDREHKDPCEYGK